MLTEQQYNFMKETTVHGRNAKIRSDAMNEVIEHLVQERLDRIAEIKTDLQHEINELESKLHELRSRADMDTRFFQRRAEQDASSIILLRKVIHDLINDGVCVGTDVSKILPKLLAEAINYDQKRKIEIIKELREFTGLGLKEAKDQIDAIMPYKPVDVGILG